MKLHLHGRTLVWQPTGMAGCIMLLLGVGGVAFGLACLFFYLYDRPAQSIAATRPPSTAPAPLQTAPPATQNYTPRSAYELTLVNAQNPMQGEAQQLEALRPLLGDASIRLKSEEMRANRAAGQALGNMLQAARSAGAGDFSIQSAYRGRQYQATLFNAEVEKNLQAGMTHPQAEADAALTVQRPGCSEHETGLAFDILAPVMDDLWDFENSSQQQWLRQHCHEYGFILRYPADKQSLTGIAYEAWHFRYVGKAAAQQMHQTGQCLEEYLAQ